MILSDLKLLEKAMNSKGFATTVNIVHDTATVGFEYEMVVPSDSRLIGDPADKDDRTTTRISWFDSIDEFKDAFDVSYSDEVSIEREYESLVNGVCNEYIKDNWDKFNDEDEDDGQQQAADEFENAVKRYVSALEIACDPKLETREYAKKITKLLNKIVTTAPTAPESELKDFPKNLLRLTKI